MPTAISWTDETWNPTSGCSHVSDGCRACYAETISLKFGFSTLPWTARNAAENVKLHPDRLRKPYTWRKPSRVFVNSMSDLFHEQIPDDYIARVFEVMADLPQHTFQILTKRPERMATWPGPWPANIWAGTTVEDSRVLGRVDELRKCPAAVRFLSCEPLLGPLDGLDLSGIDWVIAGGESGMHLRDVANRDRWMVMDWARELRDLCVLGNHLDCCPVEHAVADGNVTNLPVCDCDGHSVAYFFKQSSGYRTEMGTLLPHEDGSYWEWHQFPGEMTPPRRVLAS